MVGGMSVYGAHDVGLDTAAEERAAGLHASSVVIDVHWQGPTSPDTFTEEDLAAIEPLVEGSGGDYRVAWRYLHERALRGEFPAWEALYRRSGVTTGMAECTLGDERELLRDAYRASQNVNAFPWARRARSAADIRAAKEAGEIAFWGACAFNQTRPDQLQLVDIAHELGVLDLCELAYNTMNFIGAGCTERYDPGLSHFGVRFVERCNEVGVIVDTAHTGRQSTLDACACSARPVVASHTSAAALYPFDRAKTDDELEAIAATGGVVGVYAVPFFLGPPGSTPTIDLMLDHVDYIVGRVGWQHVAIGTDWPLAMPIGIQQRYMPANFAAIGFRAEHAIDVTSTLVGFRDPLDWPNITRGLVARGYGDDEVRGIIGENFLRVFETVVG
jgi:membrane dipeptidase